MTSGRRRPTARAARTAAPAGRAEVTSALAASGDVAWDWTLEGFADATDDPAPAWLARVHPDDRRPLIDQLRAHPADAGAPLRVEFRLADAAGGWRWWQGRGRVVAPAGGGAWPRLLGILSDVDAQRAHLNTLELSRARFQAIYETTPDAMGITRIADGKYLDVNSGFEKLTGFTRDEAVGRTSVELGIWATAAERMALVEAFRRHGAVDSMEMAVRHRSGAVVHGLMSVRGLRIDGEDCFLFTYRDITEHKRIQAEAARAQRDKAVAEAANRAKTEFLSRMSHELRTPLNAVLGFSQLLAADRSEPLSERQATQVEAIQHAGWHLLALINDVLDISRIEAGRLRVVTRAVEVHALVDEALAFVEPQARAHGVSLRRDDLATGALHAAGDPVRLRQVLLNVIGNAVKYNRPAGTVRVAAMADGGRVVVQVVDTGIGMTSEQLAHLFEPFNRLGRERSGIEGTGIGMALTRQLVELMDGTIEVRSEAGRGTTVRITLPAADAAGMGPAAGGAAAAPPGVASGEHCAGTVLYVEDNAVNQLVVQQMLARWPDLRVVLADSGERGLALARQTQPALILLDMHLPDLSGLQVLDALRADPATRALRVVALSASAMPEEVASARERGVLEYWTKPLGMDRFLADVQRLLAPVPA